MKFRHIILAALAAFALSSCATYEYVGASGDGGYYQGAPDTVYADGYYADSYYPYYYSGIWGYMDYGWPGYVGYYGFGHPYIVHPYYGHGGRHYYGSGPSWTPAHGAPGGWRNYGHGAGVLRPQSQPPAYRSAPSRSSGGGHYVPSGGSSRPAATHSGGSGGGHWSGRGH